MTVDTFTYKQMLKTDIKLVLRPIDGRGKTKLGLVDPRLFTGENVLHVFPDTQTMLWEMKYERGIVPQALKQKFTSYTALMKYVKEYYLKRNVEIVEVIDT